MSLAVMLAGSLTCTPAMAGAHESASARPAREPSQILITNVRVFDGVSAELIPADVLVDNHLISDVSENATASGADNLSVIDGGGRVLMPGIIEAHTHLSVPVPLLEVYDQDWMYVAALSAQEAEKMLMRGWTTARDIGGPTQGLARAIDEGRLTGPRIYPSAMFITQTSGHGDFRRLNDAHPNMDGQSHWFRQRYSLIADGPAEVKRAVRESLRNGAVQIKVMAGGGISSEYDPIDTAQYSVEELRAAVEAAEEWNTYVAAHAYTDEAARKALEAGVKVIEHGHLLSEDTLKLLKEKKAYLSTQTFSYVRVFFTDAPQASQSRPGDGASKGATVVQGLDRLMTTAKKLDIPVAFGTDAIGYPQAFEASVTEFGARLKWFSSYEVLKQATSINAELLSLTGPRNPYPDGPLGVIQPGAYADLLIVDGNPLEDVRLLENYADNIRLIMKDGIVYKNTL